MTDVYSTSNYDQYGSHHHDGSYDNDETGHTKLSRITGLVIMVFGAFLTLALMNWSIHDPSLNHITSESARNFAGYPGAIAADLFMQTLGLGASLAVIIMMITGWQKFKATHLSLSALRQLSAVVAVIAFCGTLACIPILKSWPLPTSLGGVVGDLLLSLISTFIGSIPEGFVALICGVILFLTTILALNYGFAMNLWGRSKDIHAQWQQSKLANAGKMEQQIKIHDPSYIDPVHMSGREFVDEDEPDQSPFISKISAGAGVIVGAIAHWYYSFKARRSRSDLAEDDHFKDDPFFNSETQNTHLSLRVEPGFKDNTLQAHEDHHQVINHATQKVSETPEMGRAYKPKATASAKGAGQKVFAGGAFEFPDVELLATPKAVIKGAQLSQTVLEQKARDLEGVLQDFGIKGEILCVRPGPVVTLYELEPAPGIKSSRVIGLSDDIARSMSAVSARVAVVPGRNVIGIELPNDGRETVYLQEMIKAEDFSGTKAKVPMCLGKTIGGEPVISDLVRMPHLLIAGTTGSGKSVAINTMILSLLYKLSPEECKLIMIDPKMLELSVYDGIPHLLSPVITDPNKAVVGLKWAVREMEDRYKKMSKLGVRNIDGYNQRVSQALEKGEVISRTVQTGFDKETGEAIFETEEFDLEKMPYIVVIVDEMADLMMVAGKDIEGAIQRLAQMARAAGIHLIMATQRPSVDVITGTIKANFPTRISFQVTSKIDSRTILGEMGAEQLLGMGDMLFMEGGGRVQRLHGPFVSDKEVEDIVNHLKAQGMPEYLDAITEDDGELAETGDGEFSPGSSGDDLYDQAIAIVMRDQKASTSYIQRRLSIGYNRAATLIERMEEEGIISPANHAGKREVLLGAEQ